MKLYTILFALLISVSSIYAQNGGIEGKIITSDKQAAAFVNVGLENQPEGTVTDADGHYELRGVPVGNYTLVASYVGLKTQKLQIEVKAGQITEVPVIVLEENSLRLEEVVISSDRNPYSEVVSEYVSKMPLKKIENPQVYNTISAKLLEDQIVTEFDDALKNAPGITKLWESTGRASDGAGYYSLRGFAVQPTMVNGVPSLTNGSPDPANIEKIEVIKGPSGTLFGSSLVSYGGLINVVTKKPYHTFGGEIGYTMGSFGLNRLTADINTPLSDEKDVAMRLVTAYETKESFQDAGFSKSFFVAPSLSYKVNERLSFLINTEIYSYEGTNPTMLFFNRSNPLAYHTLDELGYNPERSYTSNDITISTPTYSFQGQMFYKLSDNWTSQTVVSRSSAKSDGLYSYLFARPIGKVFDRYLSKQNSTTLGTDVQQNFIGDYKFGNMRNRIVAGLDFFQQKVINNNTGNIAYDSVEISGADPSQLTYAGVMNAFANTGIAKSTTRQNVYSAYASDVFNITPKISVMASVRFDHFDNAGTENAQLDTITGVYEQSTVSPKFGLVYEIFEDKLSVFANYMNGFSNVAPAIQADGSTISFDPEQANQKEVGVKTSLIDHKLVATVSYYNIEVSDVVRNDPEKIGFYIQDGENYSKGVETSVMASIATGLNLVLGYSFNESIITKTDNENIRGRRPEEAGPQHLANAWINYRISKGSLKGLGFGFGGNYMSEDYIVNKKVTGEFVLPSYTILNASVFYNNNKYRLGLKFNNLTDVEYYKGWTTLNPQLPMNVLANFTYKF